MKRGDAVEYKHSRVYRGIVESTSKYSTTVRLANENRLPNGKYTFSTCELKVIEECDPAYSEMEAA